MEKKMKGRSNLLHFKLRRTAFAKGVIRLKLCYLGARTPLEYRPAIDLEKTEYRNMISGPNQFTPQVIHPFPSYIKPLLVFSIS